jgi:TIR domain
MAKIFINYRRSVNLKDAQLLQTVLVRHFGQSHVFLDFSGLEGGEHWLHTLERQVDASGATVALIGKDWAEIKDENGQRRLDDPNDFVRFEIARAFSRKIPVLPVLIDGASIPDIARLPSNLLPLTFSQAMLLRGESFNDDADKIARRLKYLIEEAKPRGAAWWKVAAISMIVLAVGTAAGPAIFDRAKVRPLFVASPVSQDNSAQVVAGLRDEIAKQTAEARRLAKALTEEQKTAGAADKVISTLRSQLKDQERAAESAKNEAAYLSQQIEDKSRQIAAKDKEIECRKKAAERTKTATRKPETEATDWERAFRGLGVGDARKPETAAPEGEWTRAMKQFQLGDECDFGTLPKK